MNERPFSDLRRIKSGCTLPKRTGVRAQFVIRAELVTSRQTPLYFEVSEKEGRNRYPTLSYAWRKETESTELKNNLISVVERPWPVTTMSLKERISPSFPSFPSLDRRLFLGKIFLATHDRRQRLPVVVTPINNPFFTSTNPFFLSFFLSLFSPFPAT